MKTHLAIYLELGKVRIASLATLSMLASFILAAESVRWELIPVMLGVFMLACGASALNQVQERELDGLMRRTMGRPLPSGRVGVPYALAVSVASVAAGSAMIYLGSNLLAMALGLVTVLWHNGVYTPLKRVSAFAAVPGGVVRGRFHRSWVG